MSRKALCLGLLGFQIAYVALTMLSGRAPAWTMFSKAEPVDYALRNASGSIALKKHLPPVFYLSDAQMVRYAASCLCRKNPEGKPYALSIGGAEEDPCAR